MIYDYPGNLAAMRAVVLNKQRATFRSTISAAVQRLIVADPGKHATGLVLYVLALGLPDASATQRCAYIRCATNVYGKSAGRRGFC